MGARTSAVAEQRQKQRQRPGDSHQQDEVLPAARGGSGGHRQRLRPPGRQVYRWQRRGVGHQRHAQPAPATGRTAEGAVRSDRPQEPFEPALHMAAMRAGRPTGRAKAIPEDLLGTVRHWGVQFHAYLKAFSHGLVTRECRRLHPASRVAVTLTVGAQRPKCPGSGDSLDLLRPACLKARPFRCGRAAPHGQRTAPALAMSRQQEPGR